MAENVYEGLVILNSNQYARDPGGVAGKVGKIVEKCGGTTLVGRLWEERRLAYPIKGHHKGAYWLTYFRVDSEQLVKIRRELRLADEVLRSLLLKVDPRLVDALVAHADTSKPPALEESPEADKPAAVAEGTDGVEKKDATPDGA